MIAHQVGVIRNLSIRRNHHYQNPSQGLMMIISLARNSHIQSLFVAEESFAELILIILINRFLARSDSFINDTQLQATNFNWGDFYSGWVSRGARVSAILVLTVAIKIAWMWIDK